jgi:hypothetical protein
MKKVREQLSPSLVISLVALFVALGGGAYAAIGINSVGTKQLKRNAVTAAKIKRSAVTTPKVKNQAITAAKLKNNAVTSAKLANGGVASSKLADSSVVESKIADGSVSEAKLGPSVGGRVLAYAYVSGGSVVPTRSDGISDANLEIYGTATHCFKDLPEFSTYSVTAGAGLTEFDGIVAANASQAPDFDGFLCTSTPGAQLAVNTYYNDFFGGSDTWAAAKMPFTLVLYK